MTKCCPPLYDELLLLIEIQKSRIGFSLTRIPTKDDTEEVTLARSRKKRNKNNRNEMLSG